MNGRATATPGAEPVRPPAQSVEAVWRARAKDAREFLQVQEDLLRGQHKRNAGWTCATVMGFVARHGRVFEPRPKPNAYPWGVPRYCFSNAHRLVEVHKRLLYVEGYAVTDGVPFPFLHGWAVDDTSGAVIDNTLRPNNMARVLIGVVFSRETSLTRYRKADRGGDVNLIDNWREGWPLLKMSADEVKAATVQHLGEHHGEEEGRPSADAGAGTPLHAL